MTIKKHLLLSTLAVTTVLSISPLALAANTNAPVAAENAVETSSLTQDFIRSATSGNKFEIESSKLALERATDPEVKAFAKQMIADHTKVGRELETAIKNGKIDPTTPGKDMNDKHQDDLKELQNSKEFDEDYLDEQEDAHEDAIKAFEKYAENGDNEVLKAFAAKTLPSLKEHLAHIEKLDKDK